MGLGRQGALGGLRRVRTCERASQKLLKQHRGTANGSCADLGDSGIHCGECTLKDHRVQNIALRRAYDATKIWIEQTVAAR